MLGVTGCTLPGFIASRKTGLLRREGGCLARYFSSVALSFTVGMETPESMLSVCPSGPVHRLQGLGYKVSLKPLAA